MNTREVKRFVGWILGLVGGMNGGCGPIGWTSAECEIASTTTAGATSTTTLPLTCEECNSYTDCPTSKNECRVWVCSYGRCVEEDLTPEYQCADNDVPCWQGACCYTCIADDGNDLGKMDPLDGPCISGIEDHLCGFGGGLCEDCTLTDQICVKGACVKFP